LLVTVQTRAFDLWQLLRDVMAQHQSMAFHRSLRLNMIATNAPAANQPFLVWVILSDASALLIFVVALDRITRLIIDLFVRLFVWFFARFFVVLTGRSKQASTSIELSASKCVRLRLQFTIIRTHTLPTFTGCVGSLTHAHM
jgi:hypothetical protein